MSRRTYQNSRRRFPALLLLALVFSLAARSALAADLRLEAKLIWGANAPPATVNYNLADPALAATLRHHFKWTNYYEITNLAGAIPLNQSRVFRVSEQCTLNIRNLGSSLVAVECTGQAKPVIKGTNALPCVYTGTNLDDTAWFIRLRSLDAKR